MTLGILLAIFLTLGWIPMFVFRVEAFAAALPHYRGSERLWTWLGPIVIGTHVTLTCFALNFVEVQPWQGVLTALLFTAALVFWFWGRFQIGPLRLTRLPDEAPSRLRRDGAFGIVRHPLYGSYLLAAGAPLIAVPQWWLLLSYAAVVVAIAVRAKLEERRLHAQLGDEYAAYCRQVKGLIPWVW
jgi:protein-S-isoprenylcysteine O-methyltransferase Ste14